jgi:transcriptional regulator with XRE-family HTH domain
VENEPVPVASDGRPDPEVQAGRALRRLRTARGWSQEEVARQMKAYGYDFHQTMIAKIEAAQRPLRVRELADFAALYGVEAHELIYPPAGSLKEAAKEIAALRGQLREVTARAEAAAVAVAKAETDLAAAQEDYRAQSGQAAMLSGRLNYLEAQRDKLAEWEPDQ